jgi:hypothetical protein
MLFYYKYTMVHHTCMSSLHTTISAFHVPEEAVVNGVTKTVVVVVGGAAVVVGVVVGGATVVVGVVGGATVVEVVVVVGGRVVVGSS